MKPLVGEVHQPRDPKNICHPKVGSPPPRPRRAPAAPPPPLPSGARGREGQRREPNGAMRPAPSMKN